MIYFMQATRYLRLPAQSRIVAYDFAADVLPAYAVKIRAINIDLLNAKFSAQFSNGLPRIDFAVHQCAIHVKDNGGNIIDRSHGR